MKALTTLSGGHYFTLRLTRRLPTQTAADRGRPLGSSRFRYDVSVRACERRSTRPGLPVADAGTSAYPNRQALLASRPVAASGWGPRRAAVNSLGTVEQSTCDTRQTPHDDGRE